MFGNSQLTALVNLSHMANISEHVLHPITVKGLSNIVQMRENCAKVVTSMLNVQLKII